MDPPTTTGTCDSAAQIAESYRVASAGSHNASPHGSSTERPAKRQKVTRACDRCKTRKRRCNGELPCAVCSGAGKAEQCRYEAAYTRGKVVGPPLSSRLAASSTTTSHESTLEVATIPRLNGSSNEEDEGATAGEYSGQSSASAFLRRAWERFGSDRAHATDAAEEGVGQAVSVFSHGDRRLRLIPTGPTLLPERLVTLSLLATYFDSAMPTYRFLHRPTVEAWLAQMHAHEDSASVPLSSPSRCCQAIVWMVMAIASIFTAATNPDIDMSSAESEVWQEAERYHQAAEQAFGAETGKARLESVQAKLAICLYLLHTSRPNEAWYNFGTAVQLAFVVGLHRKAHDWRSAASEMVTRECRKRTFWALATLDTYLAVILGRPALVHEDDIDQSYPSAIDDEDLSSEILGSDGKDRVIDASILHAKMARIVKSAARDQGLAYHRSDQHKLQIATSYNKELSAWHNSLPTILSGAIHPQSLIPIFRRQVTVLRLAYAHALMLVNRPLLLLDSEMDTTPFEHLHACVDAARRTLDIFTGASAEGTNFAAFWFTQYVAFNAVSIVYVWLIQRKRGRLSEVPAVLGEEKLLQRAEAVQKHFAAATDLNAPSLRYHVVLKELQQETRRLLGKPLIGDSQAPGPMASAEQLVPDVELPSFDDFPLDSDLWMQLDSFPYGDYFELPNL